MRDKNNSLLSTPVQFDYLKLTEGKAPLIFPFFLRCHMRVMFARRVDTAADDTQHFTVL